MAESRALRSNASSGSAGNVAPPFAGVHLTIDLWASSGLDDYDLMESTLTEAALATGATLLRVFVHQFSPRGLTGIAMLAESHIAVHTWPEHGSAAVDIFTCGSVDPYQAVPVFESVFRPDHLVVAEQKRCVNARGIGGA